VDSLVDGGPGVVAVRIECEDGLYSAAELN